jgi:protein-L-isoaspartate(D-aspartate) O-methyltransferase
MDTLAARHQMVDQQIRTWEVLDPRVLDVLSTVPREAFVPPAYRELAFADTPIPIGFGQSMLAPLLQGRILQSLAAIESDTVLEVGTGTGYLTAAFGLLAGSVHSIDIRAEFTAAATANLRTVPQARVQLETRDAFNGAPLGEYDVIAVTGSLPVYDTRFEQALRVGGRMFAVVGVAPVMDAILVRRVDSTEWIRESLFETVIDPLVNAVAPQGFVF